MRLLIYVQHLRGIGHLRRVSNIIRCLIGHKITVLSGGLPFDEDLPNHVDIVRLPPVYAADTHGTSICLTSHKDDTTTHYKYVFQWFQHPIQLTIRSQQVDDGGSRSDQVESRFQEEKKTDTFEDTGGERV